MNIDQHLPHDISQRLRVLDVLDRLAKINLARDNMEDSLRDMLELILEVFNADRAWFVYPCNPDAPFWNVPLECTRPKWPGLFAVGVDMPVDSIISKTFSELLSIDEPTQQGSDAIPPYVAERFAVKSLLMIAIHPKIGDAWVFGLHHCESEVMHDKDDLHLFTAIAQRITDFLSILISIRQLRESEERWKFALEGAGDGVWDWNPQTDKASFSRRWKEMIGYADNEFPDSGTAWAEHLHPDDKDRVLSAIQTYFAGKQPSYAIEFRLRCKDASWKWILARGMLVSRDREGKPLRMIGTHADITERKQAEAALRRERDRNQRYLDTVQTLMVALDGDGNITMINRAGLNLLGYEEHELLGRDWFATCLPQPEGRSAIYTAFRRIMAGELKDVAYFENEVLCRDGRRRMIAWSNSCLTDDAGRLVGTLGSGQDITDVKHAELALRKSESTYRSLFENMLNGFAYCQMLFENGLPQDFIYLSVNAAFASLTGLKDVVGKKVSEVIPGIRDSDPGLFEIYGRVAASGVPERFETFVASLQMWFSISVYSPQRDYFVAVFDVITERKQAEIALRESEAQYRSLFENSMDGALLATPDGDILAANSEAQRILGYSEDELRHIGRKGLVNATDARVSAALSERKNTGRFRGEITLIRKDGTRFSAEVSSLIFESQNGQAMASVIIRDITEKIQAQERIEHLAHFDQLTGLPNRILLQDHFKYALSLAQRSGEHLAIMFLDLDNFKNINDTLGHSIGDQLLMEVSTRLKAAMREEDTVARLGGDEFIFILPGTDANGAARIAKKLIEVVSASYRIEQHELIITPSIGIAIYPEDGRDMEALSQNADTAMYQAKQTGRNDFRFFTLAMQVNSARNLQLGNDLRQALARKQLQLHYQPQISIQGGQLIGAEALLRWHHPELGMIAPAEFIPIAEDTGLIIQIGEWVLRTVATQMKVWLGQEGLPPMVVAVNLSAVQFRHANLLDTIFGILAEVGLPPGNLELELTEAVAMDNPQAAIAMMDQLHERGIRMAIDDFGTGYSSLSYLKRFKVYKLKIDQSFVHDITDDEDKAIITAIINMASSLGIHTIAEGVETASQQAFLRMQGCDEVQGYYFSKPLPAEVFEAFARQMR